MFKLEIVRDKDVFYLVVCLGFSFNFILNVVYCLKFLYLEVVFKYICRGRSRMLIVFVSFVGWVGF